MSVLHHQERRETLYEEALEEVMNEYPELHELDAQNKASEIAEERFQNEEYYSENGHPSLSAAERNRGLL